jgi:hypothetical protein
MTAIDHVPKNRSSKFDEPPKDDAPIKSQVEAVRDAYDGTMEPGSEEWKRIWVPRYLELYQARIAVERFLEAAEKLEKLPGLRKILKERVLGSPITQSLGRSQAKDALYELEIATTMRVAGFDVSLAEPDIIVSGAGLSRPVSLACKYPSSRNRLQPAISEGYAQIKKHRIDGIVCLGIDLIVAKETGLHGRIDFRRSAWSTEQIHHDRLFREFSKIEASRKGDYPAEKPLDRLMLTVAVVGIAQGGGIKHLQSSMIGCTPGHPLGPDLDLIRRRIEATDTSG